MESVEIMTENKKAKRTYKDFPTRYIGSSDIASLILVGCYKNLGLVMKPLHFGEDVEIGSHYEKIATFNSWLKIYDDEELTFDVSAKEINIFRAGEYGCIIQIIK